MARIRRMLGSIAIGLALGIPVGASSIPASPAPLAPGAADSLRAALEADRADTQHGLATSPTSYLAAVARVDFGEASSRVIGRAADCDVRLDDATVAEHALRVTVVGDSFHVESLDPAATFRAGAAERRDAVLAPGAIGLGRFVLRLSHQRFPAIIVFDPKSPGFAHVPTLHWYPIDFRYRFVLALTPNPRPDTTVILSTRGNARRAVRAGWFEFAIGGQRVRLEAHRLLEPGVDESGVSVFFRDATTGRETYGVGRYVDPVRQPDGRWLLDFNEAYNPACAISPYYNCPIPSKANRLAIAIRAGEKLATDVAPH